ncbi:hypothetical protein CGZ80_17195 [Rhodopirellula sp. MGV]|nr:hypothetical protein CGZ80_17195 [Rhodopirellula sp. MGV]PNY34098.1 hypothetical protein C2E31_25195 [Rhodopirellula baltica]
MGESSDCGRSGSGEPDFAAWVSRSIQAWGDCVAKQCRGFPRMQIEAQQELLFQLVVRDV